MVKIALIDDEPEFLHILKETLYSALSVLGLEAACMEEYVAGSVFLAEFQKGKYDLIILDIYMEDVNGITLARSIRETDTDVALAFCTESNDFASQSYEVDAKYYINKPITAEKVETMLRRTDSYKREQNRTIRLPDGFRIPQRYILYTEYCNHSVKFHIRGLEPHTIYINQSEAEQLLLPHKGFYVINKGCIVNFAQVRRLDTAAFLMWNGDSLPVARRRFKEVSDAYTAYRFAQMDEEDM